MKRAGITLTGGMWEALRSPLRRPRVSESAVRYLPAEDESRGEEYRQIGFTLAVIALSATLARRMGIDARRASLVFAAVFPIPRDEREKLLKLYERAYAEVAAPEHFARQIRTLFAQRDDLLSQVLDRLFMLAGADGRLDDARVDVLRDIAAVFDIEGGAFEAVRRRHTTHARDPYAVLGVSKSVSNDELRRTYRRLLREYHPDGLAAYGLSAADIAFAEAKTAQINQAYDAVARRRGLK